MERFWSKVNKTSDCWEWTCELTHNGYGRFRYNNKRVRAHRFAWELIHGPIPAHLYILHSCDNRKCVNPKHLRTGTQQENIQDAVDRGRHARGEICGSAILTIEQVYYIRNTYGKQHSLRELAHMFGIGKSTVQHIIHHRTWKHI